MLRNLHDFHGYVVQATDGPVGRVDDFYFDDRSWAIRFVLVVGGDPLGGRRVLIPAGAIGTADASARLLTASVTIAQLKASPDIEAHRPVSGQHDAQLFGHAEHASYWDAPGFWGEGMRPPTVLSLLHSPQAGATTPEADDVVQAQLRAHRERGDDPHLRSCGAILRYHVHAADGDIGHVEGLVVDDRTRLVGYLIVNTSDWWLGHQVLIAPSSIDELSWLEATVAVDLTRQAVKDAPRYDPKALPDRQPTGKDL